MSHIVTVESVIKHNPCYRSPDGSYDVDAIREIVGDGIPLLYGLRMAFEGLFPAADAIWYATRDGVLEQKDRSRWMEAIVTRAVTKYALGTCIDAWARKWISGEDRTKESALSAAAAARSAVSASALAAAWSAAAWSAARAAAWSAASAAALAAASSEAAESAAWAADVLVRAVAAEEAACAAPSAAAEESKRNVADLIAILE